MAETGFFVIGEEEIVIGFRFAGVPGRAACSREEALDAFDEARAANAAVVILTEDAADMVRDRLIEHQKSGEFPLVVETPPLEGGVVGRKSLLDSIREAVGISV